MACATTTLHHAVPTSEHPWPLEVSRWFPASISSLFCLMELDNLIHHPLWRDELQTWMIARSSHSIAELLYIKRYEGHPDLWFLVLYFLTRLTSNPWAMQIVHLLIATTTVYIVAQYAPFTRLQKGLYAFGYFLFFKYATISRNYALGILGECVISIIDRGYPKQFHNCGWHEPAVHGNRDLSEWQHARHHHSGHLEFIQSLRCDHRRWNGNR